jgi:ferritin-like metal-binding protein YciE
LAREVKDLRRDTRFFEREVQVDNFNEAFQDMIKDIYDAEMRVIDALPKAAEAAQNMELKQAFQQHRDQTQGHITRLKQVCQLCGFDPEGKTCAAAKGLLKEMDEIISDHDAGAVRDAMLICGGQKFEHYEIATYGTLVTWAEALGRDDCADLLQQTLDEEEETDQTLTTIAESVVNPEAVGNIANRASVI